MINAFTIGKCYYNVFNEDIHMYINAYSFWTVPHLDIIYIGKILYGTVYQ